MRSFHCMIIGVIMGALWGLALWASFDSLATASFMLEGDIYSIPLKATIAIMLPAMITLLTYQYWVPAAKRAMIWYMEQIMESEGEE